MRRLNLSGRVVTGQGDGANFTDLEWAQRQFIQKLGIHPFPGTLNLTIESPNDLRIWMELRNSSGVQVVPPDDRWCTARCYPVRVMNHAPGAIVYPEVAGYPEDQIEVIAALSLRQLFDLADGDLLALEVNRPLKVGAIIFDVDGTLVDSIDAYRVVAQKAAESLDILVTSEMIREALNTHQSFWEMVLPQERDSRGQMIEELKSRAADLWPQVLSVHGRVMPGLAETLAILRSRGAKLAIFTGSNIGTFQPLEDQDLLRFFDIIVTGRDVDKRKPDPEGLLKCARMLAMSPARCAYVGDTPIDIKASQAAGMASVAVLSGAGDSALLSAQGPDWIIHSIAQLPDVLEIEP